MKADEARTVVYLPAPRLLERLNTGLFTAQILVILFVAAVLRLNNITQPLTDVFSWRQTSTAMMADNYFRKDANIFFPEVSWSGPGPSYQGREFQTVSYLAALIYRVVGQQDWVGRGIAVLFSLWGIFALYQLVRCVWDEPHAVASALMLALLPGAIFIDRSFLPDPAMLSLVITSLWMLAVYAQAERPRYLVLACFFAGMGFPVETSRSAGGLADALHADRYLRTQAPNGATQIDHALGSGHTARWRRSLHTTCGHATSRARYPPYHFAGSGTGSGWMDPGSGGIGLFSIKIVQELTLSTGCGPGGHGACGDRTARLGPLAARSIQPSADASLLLRPTGLAGSPHGCSTGGCSAACLLYLIGARELVRKPLEFPPVQPTGRGSCRARPGADLVVWPLESGAASRSASWQ